MAAVSPDGAALQLIHGRIDLGAIVDTDVHPHPGCTGVRQTDTLLPSGIDR